ncbi:hypothetical protein LEP1GSC073_3062 [Leptospira noguchii str. Cascata]|nr:hypothetical protein LEP1GSC073_3062 [Leptospira noguchii str. Cascata]
MNSVKRSPELSVSLPELSKTLPTGRSAGRSTGVAFETKAQRSL